MSIWQRNSNESITLTCEQRHVTGSCNLVTYRDSFGEKKQFMVDCGLFQGIDESDVANDSFTVLKDFSKLPAIFVTHSHSDHVGRLVLAYKYGFRGKIVCTMQTALAIPLILEDTYKLSLVRWKKNKIRKLYTEEDIKATVNLIYPVKPYNVFKLDESVRATFWLNAHLPGSASIYFSINGINLFFTGDFKKESVFFKSRRIPAYWRREPCTIITESTYGDQLTEDQSNECTLVDNISEAMSTKKLMVIFALSQGRTEEVLFKLRQMQIDKKLDPNIPIYLDGKLTKRFFKLWSSEEFCLRRKFEPENLHMINSDGHRISVMYKHLRSYEQAPAIIVTSSGMGNYGPAQQYIAELLRDERVFFQFTSYLPEGTAARTLLNAKERELEIFLMNGQYYHAPLCEIRTTTECSGHARADVLVPFIAQFSQLRHVFVTHGSDQKRFAFSSYVQKSFAEQNRDVQIFDFTSAHVVRIYANGNVKTFRA